MAPPFRGEPGRDRHPSSSCPAVRLRKTVDEWRARHRTGTPERYPRSAVSVFVLDLEALLDQVENRERGEVDYGLDLRTGQEYVETPEDRERGNRERTFPCGSGSSSDCTTQCGRCRTEFGPGPSVPSPGTFHTSELELLADMVERGGRVDAVRSLEEQKARISLVGKVGAIANRARAATGDSTSDSGDRVWSLEPRELEREER